MTRKTRSAGKGANSPLRILRRNRGFTQEQLAALSGLTQPAIQRYETNRRNMTLKNALTLSDVLGVSPEDIAPRNSEDKSKPTQLGRRAPNGAHLDKRAGIRPRDAGIPASPEKAKLETVRNPHMGAAYVVRLTAPEFTSLCPITGQPDFAHLVIDYVPGARIVESKSFKLYLASFRNVGAFHEDCTLAVARKIVAAAKPKWLRIAGYWYPRGGIPIDVFWQTGEPPKGAWVPDTGVPAYRGRG